MKTLNASLIAVALVSTIGSTAAFAGGDPATVYSDSYSNGVVTRTYEEPRWVRQRHGRSNYRVDRQSRDTTRLNDAGIRASQH